MNERDVLAERFSAERARLRAVAYRMLGSLAEAEDAVQEHGCGWPAATPEETRVPSRTSVAG